MESTTRAIRDRGRRVAIRMAIAILFCCATGLVTSIEAGDARGVRIHFETTKSNPSGGDTITVDTGTYSIAADGRYRQDVHHSNGEHLVEIVDHKQHRVVKLNLNSKQAIIGTDRAFWPGPMSDNTPVSVGGETGMVPESSKVLLGTKAVGGVTLTGSRHTFVYSREGQSFMHIFELWMYGFEDPTIAPIILEKRIETPEEITERRISRVDPIKVTESTFTVPPDFAVVQIGQ